MNFKSKFKRMLSGVLSLAVTASILPCFPAFADEQAEPEKYLYTMFAASDSDGAITINANNFCVNGNVATNGTIVSEGNININGVRSENVEKEMLYIFNKIDEAYFSSNNIEVYDEDYSLEEMNININTPLEVAGNAELTGNININTAIKAFENVVLNGEVKNTNDSVIYSKYGDIIIDSSNVNLNGLVYAPFGNIVITAQNLNLNNVVIIADTITFNCPSVNANYSTNVANFVGNISESLNIPYEEWHYMKDANENDFPDFFEEFNNWEKLKDSDGDKLPDCVEQFMGSNPNLTDTDGDGLDDYYEVFVTYTDPTKPDSDDNGINDGDEDFDGDGLTNRDEYNRSTDPWNEDSDGDTLSDGDEVNTYGTDPLKKDTDDDGLDDNDELYFNTDPNNPDTNGNGILDGNEKFYQTFTHIVKNEDCAVKEVIVSMEGTGNLQKNTSVESVMDKDIICSEVVGLIGEPFEIESESQFDTATITFKIDQAKLGDTGFDNLLFLWYNEENYEFVEMETTHDAINSTVSITTTHFSRYMIVDKLKWFEVWRKELNYISDIKKSICHSVLAVDCSGSMSDNDHLTFDISSIYPHSLINICERYKAVYNFIDSMGADDKAAIVTFEDTATTVCGLTNDVSTLYWASTKFYNSGGTNFNAALRESINILNSSNNADRKNIVLLTDGESSVTSSIINEVINSGIKIYTVGIGNCSDNVLHYMADMTGGKFYKALNADELVDIYESIGFEKYLDLEDNDEDGLADVFEQSGMRVQNGQIIYTNYEKPDSDKDGLKDGQEIELKLKWKRIPACITGADDIVGISFFMNSNPKEDDTDKDGYSDIEDPDPLNKPDIIGDKYDFLDDEIYTIEALDTFSKRDYLDIQGASADAGTSLIMYNYNGNDNQKFRFEWCGTGYKIHSLVNEDLVLTMSLNSDGTGKLYMDYDYDKQEQIWEVLPYWNEKKDYNWINITGIIIRSKVLYYEENDTVGQPLYIHYNEKSTYVSTDRANGTRLEFNDISKWKRFGKVYMNYQGWVQDVYYADAIRAMKNYKHNLAIGLKEKTDSDCIVNGAYLIKDTEYGKEFSLQYSNIFNELGTEFYSSINDYRLLWNQLGGNFPKLKYVNTDSNNKYMDYSCCEIMATFNLLSVAGIYDVKDTSGKITNDINQYFKLATEFELSNLLFGQVITTGRWGSKPSGIGKCLSAYNVNAKDYKFLNYEFADSEFADLDNMVKNTSGFAIISTISGSIHTYFVFYDSSRSKFIAINRGSGNLYGWEFDSIKDSLRGNILCGAHILI